MALKTCSGRLVLSLQASVATVVFDQPQYFPQMCPCWCSFSQKSARLVSNMSNCKLATLQNRPLVMSSRSALLLITPKLSSSWTVTHQVTRS